jgi:hypothetical protein
METLFGQLAFTTPWALTALLALPALYLLLRVTPPAPLRIVFPATRFLEGLIPKTQTPSHTPWWILLLRLLVAALLLLSLSGPILNPANPLSGKGPLRLVIDNGWSAAQSWNDIQSEAESLIKQAGRERREIYLQTTAPEQQDKPISLRGPLSESEALANIKSLKPLPWRRDVSKMEDTPLNATTIWLSDGVQSPLEKGRIETLIASYKSNGFFTLFKPESRKMPLALKAPDATKQIPSITLFAERNTKTFKEPVHIQLLGIKGQILDDRAVTATGSVDFDIPQNLRSEASAFQIAGQKGAQAHYILDAEGTPKTVGILTTEEGAENKPLSDDGFFLKKALEPFATIITGNLTNILEQKPSMIILPDVGAMPTESLNALDAWVKGGGLLVRFAGVNMTRGQGIIPLTPEPLRNESRSVEGSLSWDKPLKIAPIEPSSPLYGLDIAADITVSQQILPQPSDDLSNKSWANLEDGTPLITAGAHEHGTLVMVHTTASPAWSNLALSGFYVGMLKRFVKLAGQPYQSHSNESGMLQPVRTMDGFGVLQKPPADVQPIDAALFAQVTPSPAHPPGIYGHSGAQRTLNLGDRLDDYMTISTPDARMYTEQQEQTLTPLLMAIAFGLLLFDLLIMTVMSAGLFFRAATLALALMCLSSTAQAQESKFSEGLYLAYIKTGNEALDTQTAQGLDVLSHILIARTSSEMQGVVGIDPEKDTLAFFPMIYWAITPDQPVPSKAALDNLQFYLDHGGTITIDTRDGGTNQNNEALKRLLSGLNIQPLIPLPEDHVLTKSFYLLKKFPGRTDAGTVWVEEQSTGRDGVSSVIITGNDWAGAWSEINIGGTDPRFYAVGASRPQELSLRTGINLMMYALTGNYKTDQVHVPAILERLGKEQ